MKEIEQIKKYALENHIPIIMDDTLLEVNKILEDIKPKRILEIGTAIGYSAIRFSKYLAQGGIIDTIERDEERIQQAIQNISDLKLGKISNIFARSFTNAKNKWYNNCRQYFIQRLCYE